MKKKLCLVAMLCVLLVFMGIILAACSGVTIAQDPNSGNVTVRPAGPDKTPESNPSEGSTETSPTTPRYAVTLAPNDPAAGTVTGAGEYESGAFVTISATTNAGYRLLGWYKGDILVSNKANYTFEMPAHDVGFTAKYEYTGQYTVTLGTDPVGAVNVSGAGVYTSGSFVTVTASSAAGFELIGWYSGTVQVSDSDSYTFEMPEHDVTLTARFAVVPISHSVALSADPVGAGVLTGAGARESGSFVSVNATANDGYQFLGWYIGNVLVSNRASYVFEMPDHDVALTARFEAIAPITYNVTLSSDPAGAGTFSGAGAYEVGESVTIHAASAEGYSFLGWYDGETKVSYGDILSYIFTMPDHDVTLTARFEAVEATIYTVTAIEVPIGSADIQDSPYYVESGNSVTVEATPAEGYNFIGWYNKAGELVSESLTYTFTPVADEDLEARFYIYANNINFWNFENSFGVTVRHEVSKDEYEQDKCILADSFDAFVIADDERDYEIVLGDNATVTFRGTYCGTYYEETVMTVADGLVYSPLGRSWWNFDQGDNGLIIISEFDWTEEASLNGEYFEYQFDLTKLDSEKSVYVITDEDLDHATVFYGGTVDRETFRFLPGHSYIIGSYDKYVESKFTGIIGGRFYAHKFVPTTDFFDHTFDALMYPNESGNGYLTFQPGDIGAFVFVENLPVTNPEEGTILINNTNGGCTVSIKHEDQYNKDILIEDAIILAGCSQSIAYGEYYIVEISNVATVTFSGTYHGIDYTAGTLLEVEQGQIRTPSGGYMWSIYENDIGIVEIVYFDGSEISSMEDVFNCVFDLTDLSLDKSISILTYSESDEMEDVKTINGGDIDTFTFSRNHIYRVGTYDRDIVGLFTGMFEGEIYSNERMYLSDMFYDGLHILFEDEFALLDCPNEKSMCEYERFSFGDFGIVIIKDFLDRNPVGTLSINNEEGSVFVTVVNSNDRIRTTLGTISAGDNQTFGIRAWDDVWETHEFYQINVSGFAAATYSGTYRGVTYINEPLAVENGYIRGLSGYYNLWEFSQGDCGTITITYAEEPARYTLTLESYPAESVMMLIGAGSYACGDSASLGLMGFSGTFMGWYEGDTLISSIPGCTYTMPDHDVTLTARFGAPTPKITLVSDPEGAGTLRMEGPVTGSMLMIYATPNEGYNFLGWYIGENLYTTSTSTMVSNLATTTYTARFELKALSPLGDLYIDNSKGSGNVTVLSYAEESNEMTEDFVLSPENKQTFSFINRNYAIEISGISVATFKGTYMGVYYADDTVLHISNGHIYSPNGYYAWTFLLNDSGSLIITGVKDEPVRYNVTLTTDPEGVGSVGIAGLSDCIGAYEQGAFVPVYSVQHEGYIFFGWYEGGTLLTHSMDYTFKMQKKDINLTARYVSEDSWNILALIVDETNGGTVFGAGIYENNSFVTISAMPDYGFRFVGWYDGDEFVSSSKEYTFEMREEDITYTAKFAYASSSDYIDEPLGCVTIYNNSEQTVTIVHYEGERGNLVVEDATISPFGEYPLSILNFVYSFLLTSNSVDVSFVGTYRGEYIEGKLGTSASESCICSPNGHFWRFLAGDSGTLTLSPHQSQPQDPPTAELYNVTITVYPEGAGTVCGLEESYEPGRPVSLSVEATKGYVFLYWEYGDSIDSNNVFVFEMPSENVYLTARFEAEGSSNPEETPALYTRINADGTGSETGEYILFGSYPQSSVTDDSLVSALNAQAGTLPTAENNQAWIGYGYYNGNSDDESMWYIDIAHSGEKYRGVYFTNYRQVFSYEDDDYDCAQGYNGYNSGTVYWFKFEPIKWRILTEKNGSALIFADVVLDAQPYKTTYTEEEGGSYYHGNEQETPYANNYAYSTIRAWLNDMFYQTAFNELEQALIWSIKVDNSATTVYPNNYQNENDARYYTCEETNDRIFLLSEQEVTRSDYGFNSDWSVADSARRSQGKASAYSQIQGVYGLDPDWFLRSPDSPGYVVQIVGGDGNAESETYVSDISAIIPALWINLGNATISPDTLDPVTLTVNIEGGEGTLRINNEPFSGTGTYDVNECFVIYVTPDFGYEVLGWYKNNDMCGAGNQFLITMTEDTTLTIRMQQRSTPKHRVLLLVEEEGTGSVMFMMGGTSATYVSGANFVAIASPAVGYEFVGWYDENDNIVSSTTPSSFTVPDHDMTLTAKFAPGSGYTLTINRDPGEPGIPLMLINGLKPFYVEGEVVTITVAPSVTNSHAFVGWYDGDEFLGEAMTYSITMPDHDVVLTAKFERLPDYYTITNQSNIEGAGSISTGYIYQCGEEVSLWATPIYGYDFLGWYEGDTLISSDADYSFNMPDRDLVYTACFGRSSWCDGFADCTFVHPTFPSMDAYMSIVRLDTYDGIVPQTTLFNYSGNQTLRFACSDRNKYWFTMGADGMQVTFNGTYNGVEYVDEILSIRGGFLYSPLGSADWRFADGDHGTVEAIYANNSDPADLPYTVTIIRDPVRVNNRLLYGADSYQSGEEVHLLAKSTIQYNFDGWYDGDSLITTDPDYTFIMPDHNMTFVAKFTVPIVTYACGDYAEGDLPEPSIPVVMGGLYVNIATNPIPTCTREGNWKFIGWSRTDGSFSPEYALGRNMYERNLEQLGSITLYPVFREEVTPDGYITIDCTNSDEMTLVIEKDGEYYDYCSNTDESPYVLGYVIGSSYRFITTRDADVSFEGVYSNSKYAENEDYFDLSLDAGGDYDWQGMICNVEGNVDWSFANGDYGTISCVYHK